MRLVAIAGHALRLTLFALLLACFLFAAAVFSRAIATGRLRMGTLERHRDAFYPRDDWVVFYAAGRLVRQGRGAEVYHLDGIRAAENHAAGDRLPADFTMPFFNPPYALLLLAPLAGLSLAASGAVWVAGGAVLFAAGIALLLATYRRRISPMVAALGLVGIFVCEPVLHVATLGQFSFLMGLGVCLLLVSPRRPHPAYPILGLLLLGLKPQLLPLPLLFLLVQRRYRVLAGAAAAAGALTLLGVAIAGPHIMLDWLRLTGQAGLWDNQYTISSFRQYGWVGLVAGLFGPGHVAARRLAVTGLDLLTIGAVALAMVRGRRAGRDSVLLLALAIVGALVASANLNPQEMLLLLPVLLALYQSAAVERGAVLAFAVAGWFVTYLQLFVINDAFLLLRPSFGMLRDAHAGPLMLALSYVSPGTLYLLALLGWLGWQTLALGGARQEVAGRAGEPALMLRRGGSLARALFARHGGRLARFALVGASGVAVNTAVLYLLVERAGLGHLTAVAVSTEAAILSNFVLNDRWTFRERAAGVGWPQRALRYNAVALGGLAVSVAVFALLSHTLGLHYLLANFFAIGAATLWNYAGSLRLAWRPGRVQALPRSEAA